MQAINTIETLDLPIICSFRIRRHRKLAWTSSDSTLSMLNSSMEEARLMIRFNLNWAPKERTSEQTLDRGKSLWKSTTMAKSGYCLPVREYRWMGSQELLIEKEVLCNNKMTTRSSRASRESASTYSSIPRAATTSTRGSNLAMSFRFTEYSMAWEIRGRIESMR